MKSLSQRIKPAQLLGLVLVNLWFACTPQEPIVQFCEELDPQEQCAVNETTFERNKEIFVRCDFNEPLKGRKIIGKVIQLQNDTEVVLGTRTFTPESGDTYITQSIPFHEFGIFGTFIIRFEDEKEQILAEKQLVITEE